LTTSPIQLFTLIDLEHPGSADCPYKTVPYKTPTANRFMHEPIRAIPQVSWLKSRLNLPETMITEDHKQTYLHALECIRQVIQSSNGLFKTWILVAGPILKAYSCFHTISTYTSSHIPYRTR
jgi:hypothetical protein